MVACKKTRFAELLNFDDAFRLKGYKILAGVDEAGRGPLAGPVVAAACVLPQKNAFYGIDDSKKVSQAERKRLFEELTSDPRVLYGVGIISPEQIDKINIYQATLQAMLSAIEALVFKPDLLLVDGMPLRFQAIPTEKIIKGDSQSLSIAAASIIAKETRDRLMADLHASWPMYGFDKHKGYGTPQHLAALRVHGPSPAHRRTFGGVLSESRGD